MKCFLIALTRANGQPTIDCSLFDGLDAMGRESPIGLPRWENQRAIESLYGFQPSLALCSMFDFSFLAGEGETEMP